MGGDPVRQGGCLCGAVRYTIAGDPIRVGLCHCADCRKESGSVFVTYGIWDRAGFSSQGDYLTYRGRGFCPQCGGRLFELQDKHVEIRLGSLDDAPMEIAPDVEGWIKRRESWLHPLRGVGQNAEDPPKLG